MNRVPSLIGYLIAGALLSTGALAHDPPPQSDNLMFRAPHERVQIAFVADCNVPQEDDAYIEDPGPREINFKLVVTGSNVGGSTGEFIDTIVMLNGNVYIADVPESIGQLLQFSIEDVSGHHGCRVSSIARLVGLNGETLALAKYRPQFYSRPACVSSDCP